MAAQTAGLTARELYYQAVTPSSGSEGSKPDPSSTGGRRPKGDRPKSTNPPKATGTDAPVTTSALRLGLRYNLLEIDPETKTWQSVDPDANFANDCLALRLTPNRTGHLFIFNRGTSGMWRRLIPDPEMPENSNLVTAGSNIQIPQNSCFRIYDKHGTDRMLVIFSERNEDFDQLSREMENLITPESGRNTPELEAGLTDRDLRIEKITEPLSTEELPQSVYAVKTAASDQDRLRIEFRIRHE